ncbi:response regulator transcription factor [Calidifontibacter terrae]
MHVLVIDPAGTIAPRLVPSLREEGHDVQESTDPCLAAWRVEVTEVDVVVFCTMQPTLGDLELVAEIGGSDLRTPIVVLTAHAPVPDVVRLLDAGADDVLISPTSGAEIGARLRSVARRSRPVPEEQLEVGTLRLVPDERRAWRNEIELELSPREFELLEFFMRHPDRLLSRNLLLHALWDLAYAGRSNVVDQQVSHIRAKIDRPFGRHDLETVRGLGYRLRAS